MSKVDSPSLLVLVAAAAEAEPCKPWDTVEESSVGLLRNEDVAAVEKGERDWIVPTVLMVSFHLSDVCGGDDGARGEDVSMDAMLFVVFVSISIAIAPNCTCLFRW
jgi:hypothetical protein